MFSLSHVFTCGTLRSAHHKFYQDLTLKDQPISFWGIYGLEHGRATGLTHDYFIEVQHLDGRISLIPKERIEELGSNLHLEETQS